MAELERAGFSFVGIDEFLLPDKRKKVLISIDDGFAQIKPVVSWLCSRGAPPVVSILGVTLSEQDYLFPFSGGQNKVQMQFLTKEDLSELKGMGAHIAYHSFFHDKIGVEDLTNSNFTVLRDISAKELFSLLSKPYVFTFPYSGPDTSDMVVGKAVASWGFDLAFVTGGDFSISDKVVHRVPMDIQFEMGVNPILYNLFLSSVRRIKRIVHRQ